MILIKNVKLISMNEKEEKIQENINILIKDNKIDKIYKKDSLENIDEKDIEKIIDASRENCYARFNKYT